MNVLVIGKGGREHAIVKSLKKSTLVTSVHALPGNDGMGFDAICHPQVKSTDLPALKTLCHQHNFKLVIIGPEAELVSGLSDFFRSLGIATFGPCQQGAKLEASKIHAKQFMQRAGVPTAKYKVVDSVESTLKVAEQFSPPYIFKADGLAGGKGVAVCENLKELEVAAHQCFVEKRFGSAGEKALLEAHLKGWEASVFVLTNGQDYEILPLAQDHKRLLDGGEGPNTGGMGVVAPMKVNPSLMNMIEKEIVIPSVRQLGKEEVNYSGVLFIGLMVDGTKASVLEYNVRFGDPETQSLLPLLDGDWGDVFYKVAQGIVPQLKWRSLYSTCVVLAAQGYPIKPVKGAKIQGQLKAENSSRYFIHAGVKKAQDEYFVDGGRVLNAIGLGSSLKESIEQAYSQSQSVHWEGLQKRSDIGCEQKRESYGLG